MTSEITIPDGHTQEHELCTTNKHIEMMRSAESNGRETERVGLSISTFAQANANAEGRHVVTKEDTERARAFCYQQAGITQQNARKSTGRTFFMSLPWAKGKYA